MLSGAPQELCPPPYSAPIPEGHDHAPVLPISCTEQGPNGVAKQPRAEPGWEPHPHPRGHMSLVLPGEVGSGKPLASNTPVSLPSGTPGPTKTHWAPPTGGGWLVSLAVLGPKHKPRDLVGPQGAPFLALLPPCWPRANLPLCASFLICGWLHLCPHVTGSVVFPGDVASTGPIMLQRTNKNESINWSRAACRTPARRRAHPEHPTGWGPACSCSHLRKQAGSRGAFPAQGSHSSAGAEAGL